MNRNDLSIPASSPFVLLADDLTWVLDIWTNVLTDFGIPYMTASSLDSLTRAFNSYKQDLSAIILDGCIPGNRVNTIDFIRMARVSGFDRPIVAASSSAVYRKDMVAAGCSHEATKQSAAYDVANLLTNTI